MYVNFIKRNYLGSYEFGGINFDVFRLDNGEVIVTCSELQGTLIGYSPMWESSLSQEENNENIMKYVKDMVENNIEDYIKQIFWEKNRLIYSR